MARTSKWIRRIELGLWIFGLSMIGVSVGAAVDRMQYQSEKQRAVSIAMSQVASVGVEASIARPEPVAAEGPQLASQTEQYDAAIGPERPEVDGALDDAAMKEPLPVPAQQAGRSVSAVAAAELAPDIAAYGVIEIPRLGLSAVVQEGVDETTLSRAVGLVPGTARPGEDGNVVLAGHRDTFFRPLSGIEVEDTIKLVVPPHTYEYRVESLRVVKPQEVSVMDSRGVDELTLVTCYPFRYIGPAPDRFIVRATRVR